MLYSDNIDVYFSYVIVTGEVYGLAINVMKPFSRSALLGNIYQIFNYILSTA